MSSDDKGLDDGISIIDDSNVSIEKADVIFIDDLMDVQERFKAMDSKARKVLANVW